MQGRVADLFYCAGCLISAGLAVAVGYRMIVSPTALANFLEGPESAVLITGLAWGLTWATRGRVNGYWGVKPIRKELWEKRIYFKKKNWKPWSRQAAYEEELKGRVIYYAVGGYIIGAILIFDINSLVEGLLMAAFLAAGIMILFVFIDAILYQLLSRVMDNRRFGQICKATCIAGTLIFVYFKVGSGLVGG